MSVRTVSGGEVASIGCGAPRTPLLGIWTRPLPGLGAEEEAIRGFLEYDVHFDLVQQLAGGGA